MCRGSSEMWWCDGVNAKLSAGTRTRITTRRGVCVRCSITDLGAVTVFENRTHEKRIQYSEVLQIKRCAIHKKSIINILLLVCLVNFVDLVHFP